MFNKIKLRYEIVKEKVFSLIEKKWGFSVCLKYRNIYAGIVNPEDRNSYRRAYVLSLKKDKRKYYILRVPCDINGLFTVARRLMRVAAWAEKNGYTVVVDWGFEEDFLKGKLGQYDFWDRIFKQPITLKEALSKPHVIVSTIDGFDRYDEGFMERVNGDAKNDRIHMLAGQEGRKYFQKWKPLVNKYLVIQPDIIEEFEEEAGWLFANHKRVLGVMVREAFTVEYKERYQDEALRNLYNAHPTNPSIEETVRIVKLYYEKWQCDYIFVSTMYEETVECFQRAFGEKVYCLKRDRVAKGQLYREKVAKADPNPTLGNPEYYKRTAVKIGIEDKIATEKNYIKEIYALSRCAYFVGANCSGTVGALLLNGGHYEDSYILKNRNENIDCSSY